MMEMCDPNIRRLVYFNIIVILTKLCEFTASNCSNVKILEQITVKTAYKRTAKGLTFFVAYSKVNIGIFS